MRGGLAGVTAGAGDGGEVAGDLPRVAAQEWNVRRHRVTVRGGLARVPGIPGRVSQEAKIARLHAAGRERWAHDNA
jgi:hypothetical protein